MNNTLKIRGQILSYDWIKNQWHFNVVLIIFWVVPEWENIYLNMAYKKFKLVFTM